MSDNIVYWCDKCEDETEHTVTPVEKLDRRGFHEVQGLVCDGCDSLTIEELDADFFEDPDYGAWERNC